MYIDDRLNFDLTYDLNVISVNMADIYGIPYFLLNI